MVKNTNKEKMNKLIKNGDGSLNKKKVVEIAKNGNEPLKSEVLLINHPISKDIILKFIKENPDIERLKGWISDADRNTWLVQKTRSECNFSISNYETLSRLVVIYKDKINLESLGI